MPSTNMARIRPPYHGGDGGGAVRFALAAGVATAGAPFFLRRREIGTSIAPAADRDNERPKITGSPDETREVRREPLPRARARGGCRRRAVDDHGVDHLAGNGAAGPA